MESIHIIIILLVITTIGRVLRKFRGSKSRREVSKPPEKTPYISSTDKKEGELLGWPGSDQFPSLSENAKDKYPEENSRENVFFDDRVKEFREKESDRGGKPKKKISTNHKKRKTRVVTLGELLQDRNDLKKGIILKEVLGIPKSREMMQKYKRSG